MYSITLVVPDEFISQYFVSMNMKPNDNPASKSHITNLFTKFVNEQLYRIDSDDFESFLNENTV